MFFHFFSGFRSSWRISEKYSLEGLRTLIYI
jgi:hypothetical protein